MQKLASYLKKHLLFILFLFGFSWIIALDNKFGIAYITGFFQFHFDAPFWIFINALIIFVVFDLIQRKGNSKAPDRASRFKYYLIYFGIAMLAYLIFTNLFGLIVALTFGTLKQNFASTFQVIANLFSNIFDFFIFGGFSLAYFYSIENRLYRQRISNYEISLAQGKVQQLKSQLNPHFLFNNLNVLDQLIDEDKYQASDFLAQFAELYRYALNSSDKELIDLDAELNFATNYFHLMEVKYQECYNLIIDQSIRKTGRLVPPFCLQVLVENAIKHNLGTKEKPVNIRLYLDNAIRISNNKVAKTRNSKGNGVALNNLNKQFKLLTRNEICINDDDEHFAVALPLLKNKIDD
ncbi:histidine kinase [Prolixibacteraceae bacterium JC049]|nr:histidine kinase [Prolixibacteraceae bacterium JC049]